MDDNFEALRREATAWIVRITSGHATADDAEDLMRWRNLSADHEAAYRDAVRLWKSLGSALAVEVPSSGMRLVTRRSFLAGGSLAAGAAGIGVLMSEIGVLPTLDAMLADYATAIGEQRTVRLPDGSTAVLDAGTAMTLGFSNERRSLKLTSGAALFEVARNDSRPFSVSAREGISSTGDASFSVQHGVDDVYVECLGGGVRVHCQGAANLVQGETIAYSSRGLGQKTETDVDTAAAWRNGLMIFNNRPLADVVSDLNRYRRGKVVITGRDLGRRRVSGVFHLERPGEILAHLEQTLHVRPINLVGGVVLLQ